MGPALAVCREDDQLVLRRDGAHVPRPSLPAAPRTPPRHGEGRATGGAFHVDTLDLYASRSRSEFTKRAAKALTVDAEPIERDLLALLVEAEKTSETREAERRDLRPRRRP